MLPTFRYLFIIQAIVAAVAVCMVILGLGRDFLAPWFVFVPVLFFGAFFLRLPYSQQVLRTYAVFMTVVGLIVLYQFLVGDSGVWRQPENWVFFANVGVAFAALVHLMGRRNSNN